MVDADDAAAALVRAWSTLGNGMPGARCDRRDGAAAVITGAPVAVWNGVWVDRVGMDEAVVEELLDVLAGTGLPHCLQVRPADRDRLGPRARARGMSASDPRPLMVLEGPPVPAPVPAGLRLRRLDPEEAHLHARLLSAAFGAPEQLVGALVVPAVLRIDGLAAWAGEVDGVVVTTALTVETGDGVGVFNVATDPDHERRGYGRAVSTAALAAAGSAWAFLESSPAGLAVYERMGFRTVEHQASWATPDAA